MSLLGAKSPVSIGGSGASLPSWSRQYGATPRRLNEEGAVVSRSRLQWWTPAWFSVLAAIALAAIGVSSIRVTEDPETASLWVKQAVFGLAGVGACLGAALISPRTWRYLAYPLTVVVILLLIFVLIPQVPHSIVRPRNGARRWINLVFFDFLPSEVAKIVLVMALAHYLRLRQNYRTLVGLLIPFAIMLVPLSLILIEPDLKTVLLFGPVMFAMLLAAGAKIKHLLAIAACGAATALTIAVISWAAARVERYPLLEPHQVERIQGLVNQMQGDKSQADSVNYQSFKAMTLIGAGGFNGLGEERSRVIVEYNKLPEDHNDMIFAVVVNRWGFTGALAVIGLYLVYLLGLVGVAAMTKNPFGRLACVGFAAIVASQMTINIGMNIGLFPITGMTLPFVSYGGSSLLSALLMTGIAVSIGLRPPDYFARSSFEFDPQREEPERFERLRRP